MIALVAALITSVYDGQRDRGTLGVNQAAGKLRGCPACARVMFLPNASLDLFHFPYTDSAGSCSRYRGQLVYLGYAEACQPMAVPTPDYVILPTEHVGV